MTNAITIPLDDLRQTAEHRPPGYVEYVLRHAVLVTDTHYTLEEHVYQRLCREFRPAAATPDPDEHFHRLWARLHEHPTGSDDLIAHVFGALPCGECRDESRAWMLRNPPVIGPGWFEFTWRWHNHVRVRQGKNPISLSDAATKYRRIG